MLDVHPPHHPTHSWKDFFIHIATICVGLLIAIGLEQSVEAIHRAHERHDLREALRAESQQIVRDSERAGTQLTLQNKYVRQVAESVSDAQRLLGSEVDGIISQLPRTREFSDHKPVSRC